MGATICHTQLDAGRAAVYGATDENPEPHFLGWLDEVDPDELFASGGAWGLQIVRRPTSAESQEV